MKRYFLTVTVLVSLGACTEKPGGPVVAIPGPKAHQIAVSVPMSELRPELGDPAYLRVFDETDSAHPIVHQLDDLNGDGSSDELFLLVGPSDQPMRLVVEPSATAPDFPSRTQAVLAVREGGTFEDGVYVGGSDYVRFEAIEVPPEQEQDSDWAMYEGPVWESDRIGWRYYLDDRNRIDIFGKKVPDLVLQDHHDDYHTISDWGADILKVGESLGIGSPAVETANGPQVIDNATSKYVEIVANGPLRSIIRSTYNGWSVDGATLDVVSELESRAGKRWTEQRIDLTGDSSGVILLTGIVKHPAAPGMVSGDEKGIFFAYTYGKQTDQGDGLGMAILVPSDFAPELGPPDSLTHLIRMKPVEGKVQYRFLASWELEHDPVPDARAFEAIVRWEASGWAEERATSAVIY